MRTPNPNRENFPVFGNSTCTTEHATANHALTMANFLPENLDLCQRFYFFWQRSRPADGASVRELPKPFLTGQHGK
jgi:hypothetical protein